LNKIVQLNDKKFKIYLSEDEILIKVKELADRINKDYAGKTPTMLIVLKGAMLFASDLIRKLKIGCKLEVISAKSYGSDMESSGLVKLKYIESNFKNSDIIIVEDIIDSGLTIKTLTDELKKYGPASIEVASILSKPQARKEDVQIKYTGFEISNLFVVGYGLDYAELGRELRDIYILYED